MSNYRKFDVKLGGTPEGSRISRARVQCLVCYDVIESHDVHDYQMCGCENQTMIDGGCEYERWGGIDMSKVNPLYEYVAKDTFLWGVLNRKTLELERKPLSALEDSHIQNLVLHLRDRNSPKLESLTISREDAMYRRDRHVRDLSILEAQVLPELEKRGLDEVTEEIPW